MPKKGVFAVHWFRRDLRFQANKALLENIEKFEGKVLGLFCFDSRFLSRADFSANRFAFFLSTLAKLKAEFEAQGGELLILDALPLDAFCVLQSEVKKAQSGVWNTLSFNRDYEPFARQRDADVISWAERNQIIVSTERDHLLIEPRELVKDNPGSYYRVFTPFYRKWRAMLTQPQFQDRIQGLEKSYPKSKQALRLKWSEVLSPEVYRNINHNALKEFTVQNEKRVTISIPSAGFQEAHSSAKKFNKVIQDYEKNRDYPSISATSRMSHFLKNGSYTTSLLIKDLDLLKKKSAGAQCYLKEIAWREFYYHLLFHCPRVENEAFQEKYKNIAWENDESKFERWKAGLTGFPLVDAGMRELKGTGLMHNRVRMIVASFLVKDLLIDWRWGERYFMEKLLDGDLAANNGGWQWAASTGCDAQPYFRIFHPITQGQRFDKQELYIKKWVPEFGTSKYPLPMVDHSVQRLKAIQLFQST